MILIHNNSAIDGNMPHTFKLRVLGGLMHKMLEREVTDKVPIPMSLGLENYSFGRSF